MTSLHREGIKMFLFTLLFDFSFYILFSSLPCQCLSTKQIVLCVFLQQRSCWSQDLWLCSGPHLPSQLHCLVPAVMEVQRSLRCCWSLIRQGQNNPNDRKVAKYHSLCYLLQYIHTTHFGESIIFLSPEKHDLSYRKT